MFNETSYNNLGAGWVAPVIGTGGAIGGKIVGGIIGGSAGGPIGMGIGFISSLIASIFGAHAAKVKREDEISGAWAASGPQAIDAVMSAYHSGKISGSDAAAALDQIQAQFYSMTQPITKYKGQFGSFPDPNAPRPPNQCNWACGTSWDLNKQIEGLKSGLNMGASGPGGLDLGALGGDPIALAGLAVVAYLLLK